MLERMDEILLESKYLFSFPVEFVVIKGDVILPFLFGLVHRDVGMPDDLIDIVKSRFYENNADTAFDVETYAIEMEWGFKYFMYCFCKRFGFCLCFVGVS